MHTRPAYRTESNSNSTSNDDSIEVEAGIECGHNRAPTPFDFRLSYVGSGLQNPLQSNLHIILNNFCLSPGEKRQMMDIIGNAINDNAKKRTNSGQPLRYCYVPTLPTGKVSGSCLALDFGCSSHYLRAALYSVKETNSMLEPIDYRAFLLTPAIRKADMSQFSDFVANCLKKMLLDNHSQLQGGEGPLYMGIAAGFDMQVKSQRNPASATVLLAGKGYQMPGFLRNDFVSQFHDAFKRAGIQIQIGTVINDAVGVLLSGIHQVSQGLHPSGVECSIGVLCHREGSNMAYLETDRDFLDMCERQILRRPQGNGYCAVVNTEAGYWVGARGELNGLANTIENYVRETLNSPFRLECITSGVWYPHILNRTIFVLRTTNTISMTVDSKWTLDLSKCFEIFTLCDQWHADKGLSDSQLATDLQSLMSAKSLSVPDAIAIAGACNAIVGRTAQAIAVGVMAIGHRIYGKLFPRMLAVAYGGSLFASLSQLKPLMEASLKSLTREMAQRDSEILLVKSDVSLGCAVTAISSGQNA